jgi:transposase
MAATTYKVCGLDVHKDTIFACVKKGRYTSDVKQFPTDSEGLSELHHWLHDERVGKVAMESTGIYWMPVWRALEQDFDLLLVNPYFIKQMPGRKSDIEDAKWIATLLDKQLLKGSLVPEKTIRILRLYLRRYCQLQGRMTRCLQEIEKHFSQCNIKIASLTSTLDSVTVISILESITKGQYEPQHLMQFVHARVANRHGKEKVLRSLQGIIEQHDVFIFKQIFEDYNHIQHQCNELLEVAEKLAIENYEEQLQLLQTIPGIKQLAAITIVAEIGGDISKFNSAEQLTGWAGLRPKNDQSAGKIKSRSITKGNKYLRKILTQTAWGASRKKDCYLNTKFHQLSVRRGNKKALIAIARKQLVIIWNVLNKKENYKEPAIKLSKKQIDKKQKYYLDKLQKLQQQIINNSTETFN